MTQSNYTKRLQVTEQLWREKNYDSCVRESGQLFESALRHLLTRLISETEDSTKRNEVLQVEGKISGGNRSYKKFTLGELVGLYREAKVFDKLRSHLSLPMLKIKHIHLDDLAVLRNAAVHGSMGEVHAEEDALQMYYWVKLLLYDTNLVINEEPKMEQNITKKKLNKYSCYECKESLEKDWNFCPFCGSAVARTCPSCSGEILPNYKICPFCEFQIRGNAKNATALKEYELLFRGAYLDSVITAQERISLEEKRLELGLTVALSDEIEEKCIPANLLKYYQTVEGVLVDGVINDLERSLLDKRQKQLGIDPALAANIEEDFLRTYGRE